MQLIQLLATSIAGDTRAVVALSRYCASLTPVQAMAPELTAISVLRRADEQNYLKVITLLLTRTTGLLNITNTLSTDQTIDLAMRIGKDYYYLRLEELLYVFQQATSGRYGKDYNRLDAATVMGWIQRYDVEERTELAISMANQPVEESTKPLNDEQLAAFYSRVADGQKTEANEEKRVSDEFRTAQNEARQRYIDEKNAGIVNDYKYTTPDAE